LREVAAELLKSCGAETGVAADDAQLALHKASSNLLTEIGRLIDRVTPSLSKAD
jgi:hypothetical protein